MDAGGVITQRFNEVNGRINQRFSEVNGRIGARMREISEMSGLNFNNTLVTVMQTSSTASPIDTGLNPLWDENREGEDLMFDSLLRKTTENVQTGSKETRYDGIINKMSAKYNVSVALIKAVIRAESGFNPTVVSKSGAQGLMQLMPATAKSLGVTDSFDVEQNIEGGTKFLRQQLDRFGGNLKLAIAAYNCGPGRIMKHQLTNLDDPDQLAKLPKETQNYVKKVTEYLYGG